MLRDVFLIKESREDQIDLQNRMMGLLIRQYKYVDGVGQDLEFSIPDLMLNNVAKARGFGQVRNVHPPGEFQYSKKDWTHRTSTCRASTVLARSSTTFHALKQAGVIILDQKAGAWDYFVPISDQAKRFARLCWQHIGYRGMTLDEHVYASFAELNALCNNDSMPDEIEAMIGKVYNLETRLAHHGIDMEFMRHIQREKNDENDSDFDGENFRD